MMKRGGSTFHLIDQAHGRFRLTGDRQRRFPSIFHRLHPAFNFHLSSFPVPEQHQNLEPKLPGWRRLAINPREPEPGATRPTEPAPSTMKQPHPLASALAARWLGNMPTSAGPSLASPSLRRLRSGPPFSGSPMPNGFETFASAPLGWLWSFFQVQTGTISGSGIEQQGVKGGVARDGRDWRLPLPLPLPLPHGQTANTSSLAQPRIAAGAKMGSHETAATR